MTFPTGWLLAAVESEGRAFLNSLLPPLPWSLQNDALFVRLTG
jgi:hypothetical protein